MESKGQLLLVGGRGFLHRELVVLSAFGDEGHLGDPLTFTRIKENPDLSEAGAQPDLPSEAWNCKGSSKRMESGVSQPQSVGAAMCEEAP